MMSVSGAEAAIDGRSSANGGTSGGSPAAPPPTPEVITSSLPGEVPEEAKRVTSIAAQHADDGSPGSSDWQSLRRSANDKTTSPVEPMQTSGNDVLRLSSVVSRTCPGRPERRIAPSTEGLSKEEVKAEDSPVATSGDPESGDDVIVLEGDDDGDHGPQDEHVSVSGAEAATGGMSSANGGTSGGSPAAPPPTPEASTSSLLGAVPEVAKRAASIAAKHGDDGSPGSSGRQSLRRSAHDGKTSPVEHEEIAGDDVLHLSSVVSQAHPGRPEMRCPQSTEGLIKQEVKAEAGPVSTTSADQGSGEDVIVVDSDDDGDQGPQDEPMMSVSGAGAASSGGISSANGGTLGGSPPAPPPTPEAITSSLSGAVPEEATRAASIAAEHGDDGSPGSSGRQNLRRSAHDRKTSPVEPMQTSGDDGLRLSSVVSRSHPGGPEMRLSPSTEGLVKQEVKAEDCPVPNSPDQGSGDDDIVLSDDDGDQGAQGYPQSDSDSDSEDEESQEDSDPDYELEDGNEEDSQQSLPTARRTRATSGGRSSANGGALGDCPAAPPPTTEADTTSLFRAVPEVVRRASGSTGNKRKQPTGEEVGPGCVGRRHLRRAAQRKGHTAAITDLPVDEDSQRQQRNTRRDIDKAKKKGCECGKVSRPHLGLPGAHGKKFARWCSQCPSKSNNAVNVASKRCECGSHQPTLGLPGGRGMKDARWCPQCPFKPDNAVDVRNKRCECGSHNPTFGLPGASGMKAAKWCSQCPSKPNNAVDVRNKRCDCGSNRPTFGLPEGSGMKAARWCSRCPSKPNNAVDVRSKRCECGSCRPTFGLPGTSGRKFARWCPQCPSKPDNVVDVVSKQCECGRHQPSFALPGTSSRKFARWCSQCPAKPNNAVDVASKRCECGSRRPTFGPPGTSGRKFARWCSKCPSKPINAVNVVNKQCECGSRIPSFGLPGASGKKGTPRWCLQCPSKPINAVNVMSTRCECASVEVANRPLDFLGPVVRRASVGGACNAPPSPTMP